MLTTAAIHTYALYPPRQLSITAALVALWLVDRASTSRFRLGHLFGGAALSGLACAADPYALVFVPLVGLSVALSSLEGPMGRAHVRLLASSRDRRDVAVRLGAALFGAATGAVPAGARGTLNCFLAPGYDPLTLLAELAAQVVERVHSVASPPPN